MSHDENHKLELHQLKASRYRIDPIADLAAEAIIHVKEWYNPQKRGIRTIQRVRLMHASMRHLIMHSIEHDPEDMAYPWKDEWGLPISQEDMPATLQSFSAVCSV